MVQGVKDQFDAAGDTKLFENAEEIFLNGVLAKSEFDGDLAITQSFGHQCHNLLFAWSEKRTTSGVEHAKRRRFRDQFDQPVELLRVKPNLSGRHPKDAFPQHPKIAIGDRQDASCPRAEPVDHHFSAAAICQNNFCDARMAQMKTPKRPNLVGKIGGSAERQQSHLWITFGYRLQN